MCGVWYAQDHRGNFDGIWFDKNETTGLYDFDGRKYYGRSYSNATTAVCFKTVEYEIYENGTRSVISVKRGVRQAI